MRIRLLTLTVLLSWLLVLSPESVVSAADEIAPQLFEAYPTELNAQRQTYYRFLRNQLPAGGIGGIAPNFVIEKLHRWTPAQTVTVAFKGGDNSLRKDIATTATEWTKYANLKLDFGSGANGTYREWSTADAQYRADIRISFDKGGYYSLIGSESNLIARPNQESMNFGGFDRNRPPDWQGTVRHEFGHALGFEHEHQHPVGGCDHDFRWEDDPGYIPTKDTDDCWYITDANGKRPGIYTVLGGCPNGWDQAKVDFNLRQLQDSHAYMLGPFDRNSIMKYYFPEWMFVAGTGSHCYSDKNTVLSPEDQKGAAAAYPRTPDLVKQFNTQRQVIVTEMLKAEGLQSNAKDHFHAQLELLK